MKKLLLLLIFLAAIPTKAQTFAGRSGGDVFILPPYRLCVGDDNGGQACFVQFGSQRAKLLGSLTLTGTLTLGQFTVANLPVLQAPGTLATVTNGTTASDCTVGGGSSVVLCQYNGALWTPIAGGGGGVITTVAGLSSYLIKGQTVSVIDGTSSTDCTVGGGTTTVVCQYTGAAWTAVGGTGTGSVTNFISGNLSPIFTTAVATATSTPDLSFTLSTASANTVLANCTSLTAVPSYCSLTTAMIPALPYLSNAAGTANLFMATPNGSSGVPSLRAIVAADIPTLNQNTTGNAATATALATVPSQCGTGQFATGIAANGNANCDIPAGGGGAFQANGVALTSSTTINFQDSSAFNGLTATFSNPSAGNVKLGFSGTLDNAGLTNSAVTVNSQTCTLGSSCTLPFQTNSSNNTSQAGINLLTSTANSVGLTVTPTNSTSNQEKFEITGASYTGTAAKATDLAAYTNFSVLGSGSGVKSWITPSGNTQCLMSDPTNFATVTPSFQTCPSGFTNPMTTLGDVIYGGASGTGTRLAGPTSPNGIPQVLTDVPASGAAVAPAWSIPGVPIDAQVGTTLTIPVTDDVHFITGSNPSATAWTGFTPANNYAFSFENLNTGLITFTPGSGTVNGAANQIIPNKWFGFYYTDNTNSFMPVLPTIAAFPSCSGAGNALTFTSATGALGCGTFSTGGSGTVNSGTTPRLSYYASSTNAVSDTGANLTWVSPTLTIGVDGTQTGVLHLASSTATGGVSLQSASAASVFTVTIPAATDTLVNLAGTQSLSNKTFVAPALGTPASGVMTNVTGLPLSTGVTGQLAIGNVGSAGLSGTSPMAIASTGAISCATCVTSAAALTSTAIMTGGGLQASQTPSATATLSSGGNMSLPGTFAVTGHVTLEAVTSTGATGTGKLVFDTSPTLATASLGSSTATTQSANDNSTKVATTAYVDAGRITCGGTSNARRCKELGWAFGDVATGSALTTSEVGYITVPIACTISGYHIMADAGTVTIKTARVATGGTALPTIGSNSISTSGVALSTGTLVNSTTTSDFTSTAIAAGDTLGFFITAVATAKQITFQLDCAQ